MQFMSVKYISQLGNVGKLTPVQCLTNHIIKKEKKKRKEKTSLHIHLRKKKKERIFIPYFKTAVSTFQTSLFHNNNNNKIQTNLEHKLSKKQTENTLLQHIFQGLLSCDVNYLYYNSSTSAKFIAI